MEERMLILNMLQQGKITADEAYKLLSVIEGKSTKSEEKEAPNTSKSSSRINTTKLEETFGRFGEKAGKLAEEMSKKAGKFTEQFTEKINSTGSQFGKNSEIISEDLAKKVEAATNDITESAVGFADKVVDYIGNVFEAGSDKHKYNSTFTYPADINTTINLFTDRFSVDVNSEETNAITVELFANSSFPDINTAELMKTIIEENFYGFTIVQPEKVWGKVVITLPKAIKSFIVNMNNSRCDLTKITAETIKCATTNEKISLSDCNGKDIELLTDNGKILVEDTSSNIIKARTTNSKIELSNCRFDNIDCKSTNGALKIHKQDKLESNDCNYSLITTDAKIQLDFNKNLIAAYNIDVLTSLGSVEITLPDINHKADKKTASLQSAVQVKSPEFDTAQSKINIRAVTTNASIIIEN